MAASLGAVAYSAVTWTAGDVITEAKLDAMVANDQAYDSHAAQGLLLNNAKSFAAKNAAGSVNANIAKIDASDNLQIGEEGVVGHTVINAGTSKLVKIKALRQDNTTDSYQANTVILCGWGFITGTGAARYINKTITFGVTFAAPPIMMCSITGYKSGADPSSLADVDGSLAGDVYASAQKPSATSFTGQCAMTDSVNITNGVRIIFTWAAIGVLT